jgi:IMP and pyridine-specific 5'-nucleotidase
VRGLQHHMTVAEAFEMAEKVMVEHMQCPEKSKLTRYCPSVGKIFVKLDMVRALAEFDRVTHITLRKYVPPSFAETRKIFNLAVVHAIAPSVKLVTLDADDTIYDDGLTLTADSPIIPLITKLMKLGIHVSLVTAAGYPGEPHRYEGRIAGLLRNFAYAIECGAPPEFVQRFHLMGGECNYLLEPHVELPLDGVGPRVQLREIAPEKWKPGRERWPQAEVDHLLDTAENCLRKTAEDLKLDVLVIRKDRAVGIIQDPKTAALLPGEYSSASGKLTYEVLEECALAVQQALKAAGVKTPHCAFNGGHDVFIDVGKGLASMRMRFQCDRSERHVLCLCVQVIKL